jgi:small subunit ribosomal protein S9
MSNSNEFLGTGRRKTSVARVRISAGSGKIQVNGRTFEVYFPLESQRMAVQQPFVTTATSGKYDVSINVVGGGPVGQAGAVRHGIARALIEAACQSVDSP